MEEECPSGERVKIPKFSDYTAFKLVSFGPLLDIHLCVLIKSKEIWSNPLSINSNGGPEISVFHSCEAVMIGGTRDMSFRFSSHIKQNIIER